MSEKEQASTSKISVTLNESDSNIKLMKERILNRIIFPSSNKIINAISLSFHTRKRLKDSVTFHDPSTGEVLESDYRIGSSLRMKEVMSTDAISGLAQLVYKDSKNSKKFPSYTSQFIVLKSKEIKDFYWDGEELFTFSLLGYKITNEALERVIEMQDYGIEKTRSEVEELEGKKNKEKEINKNKEKLERMFETREKLVDAYEKVSKSKSRDPIRRFHFISKISNKETRNPQKDNLEKSRKAILNRIMNGEYKISDSDMGKGRNDSIFDFRLTYKFTPVIPQLDEDKICGVDMGIDVPVYCGIPGSERRLQLGDKYEIQDKKFQFDKQKARMNKKRLKDPDIEPWEKERRWIKNYNNNLTKKIVDFCLKNGCGTLVIEDLSKLRQKEMEKGGKRTHAWQPGQIREILEYKCKRNGIKVKTIRPHFTSQRCYSCGHISKNNVKEKYSDTKLFYCENCGFEAHPDYNASLNIATPGIEKIIGDEIERQNKEKKETKEKKKSGKEKEEKKVDIISLFS